MKNLLKQLELGRTFSQYPTDKHLDSRYRYDDTKEVINAKSVSALIRKGHLSWDDIVIKNEIIKA